MACRVAGNCTQSRAAHFQKARSPMAVTPSGKETIENSGQFEQKY